MFQERKPPRPGPEPASVIPSSQENVKTVSPLILVSLCLHYKEQPLVSWFPGTRCEVQEWEGRGQEWGGGPSFFSITDLSVGSLS